MTNLDSVLKSRDTNLLTKVFMVFKAMVFPVVMYGCESWTIKNAECNILLSNYLRFDSTGKALEKDLSSQLPVLNTLSRFVIAFLPRSKCLLISRLQSLSGGASGNDPACQCRRHKRPWFDPWVKMIPWRRKGNPLQYSCLESSMHRGVWQATVHRVAQGRTRLKQLSMHRY